MWDLVPLAKPPKRCSELLAPCSVVAGAAGRSWHFPGCPMASSRTACRPVRRGRGGEADTAERGCLREPLHRAALTMPHQTSLSAPTTAHLLGQIVPRWPPRNFAVRCGRARRTAAAAERLEQLHHLFGVGALGRLGGRAAAYQVHDFLQQRPL